MINIRCRNFSADFEEGITVSEALSRLNIKSGDVVACREGGNVLELTTPLNKSCVLFPLTLRDDEGRRVYERSLRLVMLWAIRRIYKGTSTPSPRVRIEYSIGHGVFVTLPGIVFDNNNITRLKREMESIVKADVKFVKQIFTKEAAIEYFKNDGQPDKVDLLKRRPFPTFTMYSLEDSGMWDYFYGAMVPSAGFLKVFDIVSHAPGFVLMLPDSQNPYMSARYIPRPHHLAAFSRSNAWCEILGVTNAADLDKMLENGMLRNFIRVNEALQDESIGEIASRIVKENKRIVLIAGPSSSGKTTFAGRLGVHLQVMGIHPVKISLDNYYLDRDKIPRESDGTVDLEALSTLDTDLFQQQIAKLIERKSVEIPEFDFVTEKRKPTGTVMSLENRGVVIIEGIHGLNPALSCNLPQNIIHRIFVSALTCINLDDHNRIRTTDVRLLRRIVRDKQFRGTAPRDTLAMWESVRRGEEKWIFPYQEQADSVFNSALHYEIPVLRHFVVDYLKKIPESDPTCVMAMRLRKMLNYFPDVSEDIFDEIPPLSLLREFIGGCTIDK